MIPQLRFPEFTDAWQVKRLGDYITGLDAGVSVNSDDKPTDGTSPGILKTSCVTSGVFNPRENKRVVSSSEVKRLKEPVAADTIIISRMNTPDLVGANAYIENSNSNLFLPDRLWATKISDSASAKFIAYKLGSKEYRQKLSSLATGTSNSMKNISKDSVRGLELVTPTKSEQEKIAVFLTAIDERIAASERKCELLARYKRGVMQQLFSQEISFKKPDGSDYPDWQEKKLGEIVKNYDNLRKPISSEKRIAGDIPYYGANGIVDYVEHYIFDGEYVLVAEDGVVDVSKYPVHIVNGKFWANNHAHILQGSGISSSFLFYTLKSVKFAKFITGSAQTKLNSQVLSKIVVSMSHSSEEQQKIADFLSVLDDRIAAERTKLTAAKQFKKALLQRMFV